MAKMKTDRICKAFTERELCALEDVLSPYKNSLDSEHELLRDLYFDVVDARRWSHQFGKSQH